MAGAILTQNGTDNPYGLLEVVVSATITQNNGAKPVVNVYHFRQFSSGSSPPDKATILSQIPSVMGTYYQENIAGADSPTFHTTVRFPLIPEDAPVGDASFQVTAGPAGDRLPLDNCVTLQMLSGNRGRSWKGSKHLGPLAEGDTTMDFITNAALAPGRWGDAAATFLNPIIPGDGWQWNPCVLSRKESDFLATPPICVTADITQCVVNARIGRIKHRQAARAD